jgi:hypothetical protein
MALTTTEKTRAFRKRMRADGWEYYNIKCPIGREAEVRAFAASLTPLNQHNPNQMDLPMGVGDE